MSLTDSRADVSPKFPRERPDAVHPVIRPADAAALVLVDRSKRTPRVLLGRRNPSLRFMPGKFVFPGGRVDAGDRRVPVYGMLDTESERRLLARVARPSTSRARALALAAIRETCEETGLLIGTGEAGTPGRLPEAWGAFGAAGLFPNLEALTFVARAVTPPRLARRFDTRFFLADVTHVGHRLDGVVGAEAELVEAGWFTFAEAKRAEVPEITRAILDEVEARLKGGNRPWQPVPFYFSRGGRVYREAIA
ncbi:NUDIX hydrolase [Ancylobacter dichloromethanicus]|uniref:NUDIX hydrolase n=1 Tax=Ancylobacter dichloromethanicus TaxID=518825 RepID=A0A9W6J6M6_9HYPH|nr:NUDIX hydrolase [Ancylobacter dichloromethanicus]MBS7554645.1 NUDIX hydrolase [Ancylobacter dichloromethanicus]GLK71776.1 NUDIX hydrolase [Ancylobacter dichloromethanicus]